MSGSRQTQQRSRSTYLSQAAVQTAASDKDEVIGAVWAKAVVCFAVRDHRIAGAMDGEQGRVGPLLGHRCLECAGKGNHPI